MSELIHLITNMSDVVSSLRICINSKISLFQVVVKTDAKL